MIIGLIGFKQSGKSTAAKYLEDTYGFARHNFKDALVAEVKQNFPDLLREIALDWPLPENATTDDLFVTKPPLMRALLQNYGTEVRRRDNDNYWVSKWKVGSYKDNDIVVDDVRFINEAQAVKDRGGILIRIVRDDITTGGSHTSETEQSLIQEDHTINVQKGDFDRLYRKLDSFMKETIE